MDSTEHRPRPECQQSRRLVEPTARRRAARRQPVQAISGRLGGTIVALSALAIALWPSLPVVFAALVLQGITGGFLGPAIAAISLGLVGHSALAERLGRNQRFAATGAVTTAGLMGASAIFCRIKRYS
jgi:MFS family permease